VTQYIGAPNEVRVLIDYGGIADVWKHLDGESLLHGLLEADESHDLTRVDVTTQTP
jgi:hypothetical protein